MFKACLEKPEQEARAARTARTAKMARFVIHSLPTLPTRIEVFFMPGLLVWFPSLATLSDPLYCADAVMLPSVLLVLAGGR